MQELWHCRSGTCLETITLEKEVTRLMSIVLGHITDLVLLLFYLVLWAIHIHPQRRIWRSRSLYSAVIRFSHRTLWFTSRMRSFNTMDLRRMAWSSLKQTRTAFSAEERTGSTEDKTSADDNISDLHETIPDHFSAVQKLIDTKADSRALTCTPGVDALLITLTPLLFRCHRYTTKDDTYLQKSNQAS